MQSAPQQLLLTNQQVLDSVKAINSLMVRSDIPSKASYLIAKAARRLDRDRAAVFAEIGKIQDRHLLRDDAGKPVIPEVEEGQEAAPGKIILKDRDAFQRELDEFLAHEANDYTDVLRIKLSHFGSCSVEPSVMYNLDWLIVDDSDAATG